MQKYVVRFYFRDISQRKVSSQWRHNERDGVSNHRRVDCLPSRLFKHRSQKTSKLRVTDLCEGIHRWPVILPHKGPATRKFPFDDVIMGRKISTRECTARNIVQVYHTRTDFLNHLHDVVFEWCPAADYGLVTYKLFPHCKAFMRGIHRLLVNET